MIDVQTMWRRVQGRWASMRRVPTVYLHAPTAAQEDASAQALNAFGLWCSAHPGVRCRVGLSGQWLLHSVSGLAERNEPLLKQALAQWAHYLDLDEAVLMRDWLVREVTLPAVPLVCATPRSLVEGLQQQARAHGVQLDWVGPWWAHGVQAWLLDQGPEAAQHVGNRTLHLVEPELVTHVQATVTSDEKWALHRIWSDRDAWQAQMPGHHGVVLHAPQPDELASNALHACLWDHAALQPVLTGADTCWKVPS